MKRLLLALPLVLLAAALFSRDARALCAASMSAAGSCSDVTGPASSADNAVARFDGTGGKTLQDSACTISDLGAVTCTLTGGGASVFATDNINNMRLTVRNTSVWAQLGVDSNTAFVGSESNNNVAFRIWGAEKARLDTSGQFGINDTTPDAQLDVTVGDAARVGQVIDLAASQTADAWQIKNSGGSTLIAIAANGALDLNDPGSKPTCDSTQRGRIWYDEGGAGVADTAEICAKNSSDTYAWYALATIP